MKSLVAIFTCFTLGGCGAVQSIHVSEARMALTDDETSCREQWPAVTRQTAIPRAACINEAEQTTLLPVSGGFADLVAQRIAYRAALAGKIADGGITPEMAQYSFAKFNAALTIQAHARPVQTDETRAILEQAFPASEATEAVLEASRPGAERPPMAE